MPKEQGSPSQMEGRGRTSLPFPPRDEHLKAQNPQSHQGSAGPTGVNFRVPYMHQFHAYNCSFWRPGRFAWTAAISRNTSGANLMASQVSEPAHLQSLGLSQPARHPVSLLAYIFRILNFSCFPCGRKLEATLANFPGLITVTPDTTEQRRRIMGNLDSIPQGCLGKSIRWPQTKPKLA